MPVMFLTAEGRKQEHCVRLAYEAHSHSPQSNRRQEVSEPSKLRDSSASLWEGQGEYADSQCGPPPAGGRDCQAPGKLFQKESKLFSH